MRLAIDGMGNDRGPLPIVAGVRSFLEKDAESTVVLVGDEPALRKALAEAGASDTPRLEIVHASQVMEMDDKVSALREKRDSSIVRVVQEVKEGRADAMVALGNTAAAVGAATIGLRNLKGVRRPGIAVPMPTRTSSPCIAIDMGANTVAKPEHLRDYAVMASIYAQQIFHIETPRVGLLNVGAERGKGNPVFREAYDLLEAAPVNFLGNVEGGDIFNATCDVVVCDGFTGNVVLKVSEEICVTLVHWIKDALGRSLLAKAGAWMARTAFREVKRRTDYANYGGAPLLGVNGICIIGHGRSNADAVVSALRTARESVEVGLNDRIRDRLAMIAADEDDRPEAEDASAAAS